jgi:hypothetical protein
MTAHVVAGLQTGQIEFGVATNRNEELKNGRSKVLPLGNVGVPTFCTRRSV